MGRSQLGQHGRDLLIDETQKAATDGPESDGESVVGAGASSGSPASGVPGEGEAEAAGQGPPLSKRPKSSKKSEIITLDSPVPKAPTAIITHSLLSNELKSGNGSDTTDMHREQVERCVKVVLPLVREWLAIGLRRRSRSLLSRAMALATALSLDLSTVLGDKGDVDMSFLSKLMMPVRPGDQLLTCVHMREDVIPPTIASM